MAQRKGRRAAARFTAGRRAAALSAMRETGNRRAAAEAVGVDVTTIDYWLKRDAAFAADWEAAAAAADRRLAGARSAFDGVGDGRFEVIQRSRTGRLQIMAVRGKRWTKAIEDRFVDALRTCGNIAACARLIGFSEASFWQRRDKWPAFAARIEKAQEEAEVALEFRLACLGNNLGAGMDWDADDGSEARETGTGDGAPADPAEAIPFDPEFALRFLKWREQKRCGLRHGPVGAPPPIEEVTERIVRRVLAIKRHRARGRDAGGEGGASPKPGPTP